MLAGAAMAGAVMVSYAKARAESLVPRAEVGFWDRPERLVLMILGALSNRMEVALWILAIALISLSCIVSCTPGGTRKHPRRVPSSTVAREGPNSTIHDIRALSHSAGRGRA